MRKVEVIPVVKGALGTDTLRNGQKIRLAPDPYSTTETLFT